MREPVVVAVGDADVAIAVADGVRLLTSVTEPTARFDGEVEAALRLMMGRLDAAHTPANLHVTGNVTLDQLRGVFPGF